MGGVADAQQARPEIAFFAVLGSGLPCAIGNALLIVVGMRIVFALAG